MAAPVSSSAPSDLDIGLLSREYEPLRELGRGGMGWVVMARHRIARHEVAIKVSAPGAFAGREALARLQREAQVLSELRSPNIVRLYDLVDIGRGRFAIVMEYVRGRSLADVLRADGRLPVERVQSILVDLITALAHAHQRGIVHRDVKPGNVLLNGESWVAKLCDFGIARGAQGDAAVTSPELLMGTPAYMSPEHIDGKPLDPRSDIYSLGLVGWEMLSGEQPWAGLALFDVLYRQKTALLPPIESVRDDVSPALALALEGALAKERSLRWTAVDEMLMQLRSDEPTARLLALRAERFAFELEHRPRDVRAAGGSLVAAPTPTTARPAVAARSPEREERLTSPGDASATLPATVQLKVTRSPAVSVPAQIETTPPPADATIPLLRSGASMLQRSAAEAPRLDGPAVAPASPSDPSPPTPAPPPASSVASAQQSGAPATATAQRSSHEPPPMADAEVRDITNSGGGDAEVLHEVSDRRLRVTSAATLALVTALLLFAVARRALVGNSPAVETPLAAGKRGAVSAAPLPEMAILPGIARDSAANGAVAGTGAAQARGASSRRPIGSGKAQPIDSAVALLDRFAGVRLGGDEGAMLRTALDAALFLERKGRLAEAAQLLDEAISAAPRRGMLYALRARVRHAAGRERDAWTDLELARRTGASLNVLVLEAQWIRHRDGLAAARAAMDAVRRDALAAPSGLSPERAIAVARALVAIDDRGGAIAVLERMGGSPGTRALLVDDPYLRAIASEPRFRALIARQNLF